MSDDLVLVFIPALVALLTAAETTRGRPLTEAEVTAIRDDAVTIALPRADAQAMAAARGYEDIDPELAWEQWQAVRGKP
ncbi:MULTISPECIES: hypothetical protein [unclassified Luteococcus]|uniref:hypothetical protein n=1 Tax=unclassified Luteococcus TaxID=2639923 RepID=UPI00313AB236